MRANRLKVLMGLAGVAMLGASARGAIWNEVGDAGNSLATAQATAGVTPLTAISGRLSAADTVDMYVLTITNPLLFSISTVGGATYDTQLFLFDSLGLGITHNDDTAANTQSRITGQFVPAAGTYYLAISTFDVDPVASNGQQHWDDTPYTTERQPDGPGRTRRMSAWSGTGGAGGAYTMAVTGANFSTVPTPGTFVLAGIAGFACLHRQRWSHAAV